MTDISITERRLRPIEEAVSSRNWKQALQQCDKWQKKGEKSDRFLALKASILISQPDKSQIEKGKAETLQLCKRTPAVTDIKALYLLQESLHHLSLHREEGPKLWDRAVAARPNDKELLTTLLNGAIDDGNWMSAQKAAMALRKAFPKERQYDFWNILLCYLIHQDEQLAEKDRDLFGRLAYMLMSKAAEAVPSTKEELLTTGKEISTPEEVALMTKIYNSTGHAQQAVKLLQSQSLGLESRVAELDPQFAFSLLLEALDASEDKTQVFETCKSLIHSGSPVSKQHLEDDRVWQILKNICNDSMTSRDTLENCVQLAQSTYRSEPKCRAAYLAYFDLATQRNGHDGDNDDDSIAEACIAFYEAFSNKPFCFGDLVGTLTSSKSTLDKFCSQVQPSDGNEIQQAFDLKLRHACLEVNDNEIFETQSLKLVIDAVQLHQRIPKEKSECPEMILLAATTLLQLALRTKKSHYSLQANFMLQNCYAKFNEYYPIAIRQVQIHLTQGQILLAMEKFASLAVKNLQWETVGHLLLTRISTLHPWPSGKFEDQTHPLACLDSGLSMLENADRSLDRAIREGLKYGSYSNIIDSVNVKEKMNRSMNRQIFIVEERRIQRLIGVPQDLPLDPYPANMIDSRDFSFLPDLGIFKDRNELETSLACGPTPQKLWLIAMSLQDHLATYLKAELVSQTTLAAPALARLATTLEKVKQQEEWASHLTSSEFTSLTCHQTLAEAIQLPPTSKQDEFNALIDSLLQWLDTTSTSPLSGTTTINGVETPTWEFLHASFTGLETLQIISHFLSVQARRTKTTKAGKGIVIPKDKLAELQSKVTSAEASIHEQVTKVKAEINAAGVLGKLVDAAAGRIESVEVEEYKALAKVYADLVEEVGLEEYCGRMKEGWEDALDGILRVKVRLVK